MGKDKRKHKHDRSGIEDEHQEPMAPLPPPNDCPSEAKRVEMNSPPTTQDNSDNSEAHTTAGMAQSWNNSRRGADKGLSSTKFGSNAVAQTEQSARSRNRNRDNENLVEESEEDDDPELAMESHTGAFAVGQGAVRPRVRNTEAFLRSSQGTQVGDDSTTALENGQFTQPVVVGDNNLDDEQVFATHVGAYVAGEQQRKRTTAIEATVLQDETIVGAQTWRTFRRLIFLAVILVGVTLAITLPLMLQHDEQDGLQDTPSPTSAARESFDETYPNCVVTDPGRLGNGDCDGGQYMTEECGYDDGDCLDFLETYPNCTVEYPSSIKNGICNGGSYMTEECGFDGGDCLVANYTGCIVEDPSWIGDGICNGGPYMTEKCGFDGGDCPLVKYPNCTVDNPKWIWDGRCNGGLYMTEECGFDGGDCLDFMATYPDCNVTEPFLVGDKECNGGLYMTEECGFDGGDCLEFMDKYPNCNVPDPFLVGNDYCDDGLYNTMACGYDGGDCL